MAIPGVEEGLAGLDCTVKDSARFVMGGYAKNNSSFAINHGLQALCQKEWIRCGNIQWEQLYFKEWLHFNKFGASGVFLRALGMELGNFLQTNYMARGKVIQEEVVKREKI